MNNIRLNKKILFFPIKFFLGFLIITELLFFLGPIDFPVTSIFPILFYLIIVNISLYLGYKRGIEKYNYNSPISSVNYSRTLKFILIFSLIFTVPRIMNSWNMSSLSPALFLNRLIDGINSPMDVYSDKGGGGITSFGYFIMILSSITYMAIPLGIYNWKKLKFAYKLIALYLIFIEISLWLGIGTRKGILDTLIIIVMLLIASNLKFITEPKKYKKYYIAIIGSIVLFISYFIYSNLSRYNSDSLDAFESLISLTIKDFYKNNFPTSVYMTIYSVEGYLCQGYYALAKALSLDDFYFSYGLGSSWFQINIAERLDYNPVPNTYLYALQQKFGINAAGNWHTIYLWLANDFTFVGVPIVIFYIGKYFAKSWIETILNRDFFAPVVFSLFSLMIFYFFANNQVLSFSFIPFFTSLFLWKFKFRIN